MGFTSSREWQTKQNVIDYRLSGWKKEDRYIKHSVVGNRLWILAKSYEDDKPNIFLDIIRKDGDYGYGYSDMSAMSHPYYYDCPLNFLDLTEDGGADFENWKRLVVDYHKAKKERSKKAAKIEIGDTLVFVQGTSVRGHSLKEAQVIGIKPLLVAFLGMTVKVSPRHIAEVKKGSNENGN